MPLIRCGSCAYANAISAKVCKKCGSALRVPSHLQRCTHCGALNPLEATACVHCYRRLAGSRWRRLRGRPARGAAAAAAVLLAALGYYGYYAYPRGLPPDAPSARAVAPPDAPLAKPPPAAAETPRANRPPGDAPRVKPAPVAVAREPDAARKAGDPKAPVVQSCDEGVAALGLCRRTEARQPTPPQACTEAVAALGLCESRNTQGRE